MKAAFFLLACALAAQTQAAEPITVTVSKIQGLNLRIYGFVETDYITDSTQPPFTEEQDNFLVPTRSTFGGAAPNYAGQHGRAMMSIRNSRLGFELNVPKLDTGLQAQGVLELDLLGNSAPNTTPGATPGAQSERDFFNNPALRIRHAYMNLTFEDWNAKVGQYWSLLGWQPYYFPGENAVLATPGLLYRRFAQARVTYAQDLPGSWELQGAADLARPADMNSGSPEYQAGLRLASKAVVGASSYGAGTNMIGLSAALSAAVIPFQTSLGNPTGGAVAFDWFVPIIPSADGQDRSNNLVWGGELMSGSGVGGLEYAGLTSGVPAVPASLAGTALDSGMAGINNGGAVSLIRYRAFRTHLEYTLPGGRWAAGAGYAQVETRNLGDFGFFATQSLADLGLKSPALLCPKIQYGYASLFYDPRSWLRLAGEFSRTRDTYVDAANRFAADNRFQLTAFFVF